MKKINDLKPEWHLQENSDFEGIEEIKTFERKGLNISLKVRGLDEDGRLEVKWKILGSEVIKGINKYEDDGFYFGGLFDQKEGVIRLRRGFNIKGNSKKINGIKLENDILDYFIETEKRLKNKTKEQFEKIINELVSGAIKIEWYDTTEYFDGYDYPVKKFKFDADIPKNYHRRDIQEKALKIMGFNVVSYNSSEFIERALKDNKKIGEMTLTEVLKERIERKAKKEEEFNKLVETAKTTGKKQFYKEYSAECNDDDEECGIDIIQEFVDENGKIHQERSHTY